MTGLGPGSKEMDWLDKSLIGARHILIDQLESNQSHNPQIYNELGFQRVLVFCLCVLFVCVVKHVHVNMYV